jgi:hypothetical protein
MSTLHHKQLLVFLQPFAYGMVKDRHIFRTCADSCRRDRLYISILADGNYCDIMLASGSTHKMTFQLHYFEDYLTRLENRCFSRVGRSLIVNKKHIRVINITERTIRFGGHTVSDKVPSLKMARLGRDSLLKLKNEMTSYEE